MGEPQIAPETSEPAWRERAVAKSLDAARSRAEKRAQRYLDAALELMDEKGSADFTIQEVIERSKQSLRGFYQYFDGKDELLLALFEDSVFDSATALHDAVDRETDPVARLRAFTICLHERCQVVDTHRARRVQNPTPLSEFSVQLAVNHPDRVKTAMEPVSRMLLELVQDAATAGAVEIADPRQSAALVQQLVMYSWLGNRIIEDPRMRLTAEQTWEFCLHGLRGAGVPAVLTPPG